MSQHKCQRCGKCCLEVGKTFWKHGASDSSGKPFGDHGLLNKLANNGHQDDLGPCEMFVQIGAGNLCAIEKWAGLQYKPRACVLYPEDGEECLNEESPNERYPRGSSKVL